MTKVAILPMPTGQGALSYRAIAGEKHAQGKTAGEALDALTAQLSADEASTLVIVQSLRPDRFFFFRGGRGGGPDLVATAAFWSSAALPRPRSKLPSPAHGALLTA